MAAHTVRRRGTDSSWRGIYASDYMWAWWLQVLDDPHVRPFAHLVTITQGAWMTVAGGGATQSAGYHDGGGCFDLRVRNLTGRQVVTLVWAIRRHGAAAWLRDRAHGGFDDPHIHLVLGTDYDLDDGAAWQWREYQAGRNGLASAGRDYHRRPQPLVLRPPEVDPMSQYADQLDRIERQTKRAVTILINQRDAARRRQKVLLTRITQLRKQGRATAAELDEIQSQLEHLLDEDEA